jgi:ABC-type transporter Mla MlaB component
VTAVLKISDGGISDSDVTLRLDGEVTGRWVEVLRTSCDVALRRGARLTLDLSHVSFADSEGIVLLRSLTDRQVRLVNASPFVAEQLRRARP